MFFKLVTPESALIVTPDQDENYCVPEGIDCCECESCPWGEACWTDGCEVGDCPEEGGNNSVYPPS